MFSRVSIKRTAAAFMALAVGMTAVLGALIFGMRQQRADATNVVAAETTKLTRYQTARAAALTETTNIAGYVVLRDPLALPEIASARAEVLSSLSALRGEEAQHDAGQLARPEQLIETYEGLARRYDRVLELAVAGDWAGIMSLGVNDGLALEGVAFLDDLEFAVDDAHLALLAAQDRARRAEERSDAMMMSIVIAWCALLLGAGITLRVAVAQPLDRVAEAARRIAEGHTGERAPSNGPVEIAKLGRDLNAMAETLLSRSEQLALRGAELEDANGSLACLLDVEREHARRDPLTGALNHGALADELRRLVSPESNGRHFAVAMVDVNGLKDINDTFGHQTGDEVLRRVATGLSRDGAIVGRYGGDEFVALLSHCDVGAAAKYVDGVRAAMEAAWFCDAQTGAGVAVSASIGLAAYPAEGTRIEELISRADSAMYAAKRQRPEMAGADGARQSIDDGMATRMIGELVPLMAAAGTLDEKLGLIAQRLSQGTGYAGATFDVFERGSEDVQDRSTTIGTNAYADAPEALVDEWRSESRTVYNHPIGNLMRENLRPVLMDDVSTTPYVTEEQRRILSAVGIRSAIVVPLVWQSEYIGTMAVGSRELAAFTPRDARFLTTVAGHAAAIIRSERMMEELRLATQQLAASHGETVMMLAASVEAHDSTTGRHLLRVRVLTEALARELAQDADAIGDVGIASMLPDIGKVRVPDAILKSPDRLSEDEWLSMKQHTTWGAEFLESHGGFGLAATIARAHHERWDGSGYPHGLVGDTIPVAAQIVSVADAYDAMTSDRPYRLGRSQRRAVREIFAHSGTQFSPAVVAALLRLYRRGALPSGETPAEDIAA